MKRDHTRIGGLRDRVVPPRSGWPVDGEEIRWGVPTALLCLIAAQAVAVVWAVSMAGAVYGSDPLPPAEERPIWILPLFNIGLWAGYVAGPLLVRRLTASGPLVDFDFRVSPTQAVVALVLGVGAQLVLLPGLYRVVLRFVDGDPGRSAEALTERVDGPTDVILFVVSVVVIAPVVEEWFYRGLLLPTFARRIGPIGGAVVSSAIFALVHQEAILLPGLFVLALLLSYLTARTARIGPAVVAHMAFNATTVVQLLVF